MPSSSSYNASQDLWFQYFKDDHTPQSLLLLAIYGIRSFWATVGIISNISIVYVTFLNKSLHGVCNIFIALESFFAIFQDASYFVSFLVFLSGLKFIPYQICFPILIPMSMCGDTAQMAMLFTGIDRLLCVLFPIWYKNRNKKRYLCFAIGILLVYALYQFAINYVDFLQSDAVLMSCSTHEMGQGGLGTLMYVNGVVLSGTLMAIYGLIWVFVFLLRPIAKTVNENNRKLIKSLIFIISLNLIGVFIKCSMSVVFANFWGVTVFVKASFAIGMSFLTITVYSANAPVLYAMSSEYRTKFNDQFKWLPKLLAKGNSVAPSHPQYQPSSSSNAFTNTVQNYGAALKASQLFIRRTNFST